MFLHFMQKFKMATKIGEEIIFAKSLKNFAEIALSHSVSEINRFLHLTQKFKMATKSGGENNFGKRCQ